MNVEELREMLQQEGIPENSYSILSGNLPNERLCLSYTDKEGWIVYYSEKGVRTGLRRFSSEGDACLYFWEKITHTGDPGAYGTDQHALAVEKHFLSRKDKAAMMLAGISTACVLVFAALCAAWMAFSGDFAEKIYDTLSETDLSGTVGGDWMEIFGLFGSGAAWAVHIIFAVFVLVLLGSGIWLLIFWVAGFACRDKSVVFRVLMVAGQVPLVIIGFSILSASLLGLAALAWYALEVVLVFLPGRRGNAVE